MIYYFLITSLLVAVIILAVCLANKNKKPAQPPAPAPVEEKTVYVPQYELKQTVVTDCEKSYMEIIENELPKDYRLLVQQPLNSFITKIKQYPGEFQQELNRVVDFLITSRDFAPLGVIEINDRLHHTTERKARDEKVKNICISAKIPMLILDTEEDSDKWEIKKDVRNLLNEILRFKS